MSDLISVTPKRNRSRNKRPERIDIDGDVLIRNDVLAAEQGTSERTVNRLDAQGAPYTYVGGVKYRPLGGYRRFLTSRIEQAKAPKRPTIHGQRLARAKSKRKGAAR